MKRWKVKYYKGLGTSTAAEAKEYFSDLGKHRKDFVYKGDADDEAVQLAFGKDKDDLMRRKDWVQSYSPALEAPDYGSCLTYFEFVHTELILFSYYSTKRSVPSLVDGLKPGQRKVLYACLKRNLSKEIKVGQLSGYVSENTGYHHGEAALHDTIINMAHNYVGSNNIPLLFPSGQFGTRHLGGKDAASPRYIFTRLQSVVRTIFKAEDDGILVHRDDDGEVVEPVNYLPTIPMVLVNGALGIGTGYSTNVPCFNPIQIIQCLRMKLEGKSLANTPLLPWYRKFTGTVQPDPNHPQKYLTVGTLLVEADRGPTATTRTLHISELPVGKWTQDYKKFLVGLDLQSLSEYHTEDCVRFTVEMDRAKFEEIGPHNLVSYFQLSTRLSISNMNLFGWDDTNLHFFSDPREILDQFFGTRLHQYQARKDFLLSALAKKHRKAANQLKFVTAVVEGSLVIFKKSTKSLVEELASLGFDPWQEEGESQQDKDNNKDALLQGRDNDKDADLAASAAGFNYLLGMRLTSLTQEKIQQLQSDVASLDEQLQTLHKQTASSLWLRDLEELEQGLTTALELEEKARALQTEHFETSSAQPTAAVSTSAKRKAKKAPAKPKSKSAAKAKTSRKKTAAAAKAKKPKKKAAAAAKTTKKRASSKK